MPATGHPRVRRNEQAVTLFEIVAVLLIIAIILSIGLSMLRSSRGAGRALSALTVAHAYGDAVDAFAREHRGRFPEAPGSTDWSDAERGPEAGPLGDVRYYLRRTPEPVQDGTVTMGGSGDAVLTYRQLGNGAGYEIEVAVTGRPPCVVRGGSPTVASGTAECGRR